MTKSTIAFTYFDCEHVGFGCVQFKDSMIPLFLHIIDFLVPAEHFELRFQFRIRLHDMKYHFIVIILDKNFIFSFDLGTRSGCNPYFRLLPGHHNTTITNCKLREVNKTKFACVSHLFVWKLCKFGCYLCKVSFFCSMSMKQSRFFLRWIRFFLVRLLFHVALCSL